MPIRKIYSWIFLIACCGFINAQARMLEKPVTVMAETELKIERGNCLVYWKPLYCIFPGTGYRLEVVNGSRHGKNPVRKFTVNLNGSDELSGPKKNDPLGKQEAEVCMDGRTILRVTLRGEPGEGIVVRIWGDAGQVNLARHVIGGGRCVQQFSSQQASAGVEKPPPIIILEVDKEAITIGQMVKLTWDAQSAILARFSFGDLGAVESSGSALVWPEKDTTYRLEAQGRGETLSTKPKLNWPWSEEVLLTATASAEVQVKVTVPDPELELDIEPKTVYEGQEATLTWKTKNARLVHFGEQGHEVLPLSGKMNFKPDMNALFTPIVLTAENGDKKVRKSATVRVLDPEEERLRIEKEKASRTIPKDIDKSLRGIWDELKTSLRAGEAEKAASFFCIEKRGDYLALYKDLKDKLPQIGEEMKEIEFLAFEGNGAIYRTKRKEIIKGKEYDISYRVYFIIDQDGQWRIYKF